MKKIPVILFVLLMFPIGSSQADSLWQTKNNDEYSSVFRSVDTGNRYKYRYFTLSINLSKKNKCLPEISTFMGNSPNYGNFVKVDNYTSDKVSYLDVSGTKFYPLKQYSFIYDNGIDMVLAGVGNSFLNKIIYSTYDSVKSVRSVVIPNLIYVDFDLKGIDRPLGWAISECRNK